MEYCIAKPVTDEILTLNSASGSLQIIYTPEDETHLLPTPFVIGVI